MSQNLTATDYPPGYPHERKVKRIFQGEPGYEEALADQAKVGLHEPGRRPNSVFVRIDERGKQQMEKMLRDAEEHGTPELVIL